MFPVSYAELEVRLRVSEKQLEDLRTQHSGEASGGQVSIHFFTSDAETCKLPVSSSELQTDSL